MIRAQFSSTPGPMYLHQQEAGVRCCWLTAPLLYPLHSHRSGYKGQRSRGSHTQNQTQNTPVNALWCTSARGDGVIMAGITLAESLSYTVKDLSDQQTEDMHSKGNERWFQPKTTNSLWSCLWRCPTDFRTKVMSGLCTKSWLLRSLSLHRSLCSHQGGRSGWSFTAAEVSKGEGGKENCTKPCQPRNWHGDPWAVPSGPAMLCCLQISVLPCPAWGRMLEEGRRVLRPPRTPPECFLVWSGWKAAMALFGDAGTRCVCPI